KKGRAMTGEKCHLSKITDEHRKEIIKRCFEDKEPQNKIAQIFNVTPQAIRSIIRKAEKKYGKIWGTNKKTTEEDREKIKHLYKLGISQRQISKQYSLAPSTVGYIIHSNGPKK